MGQRSYSSPARTSARTLARPATENSPKAGIHRWGRRCVPATKNGKREGGATPPFEAGLDRRLSAPAAACGVAPPSRANECVACSTTPHEQENPDAVDQTAHEPRQVRAPHLPAAGTDSRRARTE